MSQKKKKRRRKSSRGSSGPYSLEFRLSVVRMYLGEQHLYDALHCARGDMENRFKEQQLCLFAN